MTISPTAILLSLLDSRMRTRTLERCASRARRARPRDHLQARGQAPTAPKWSLAQGHLLLYTGHHTGKLASLSQSNATHETAQQFPGRKAAYFAHSTTYVSLIRGLAFSNTSLMRRPAACSCSEDAWDWSKNGYGATVCPSTTRRIGDSR